MLRLELRVDFGCYVSDRFQLKIISFKLRVLLVPFVQKNCLSTDRDLLLINGAGVDSKGSFRFDIVDARMLF